MGNLFGFLLSVMAGVVSNCICKWFDGFIRRR